MRAIPVSLALLSVALFAAGCSVESNGRKDNADVKIETPFGGMKVKTNEAVSTAEIGLAAYPGATPVKGEHGKDTDSADVDMKFGDFRLRVKAATFRTSDSQEKVKAFYRSELTHYGDVIECKDKVAVGKPARTSEGLGCSDDESKTKINISDQHAGELRAGSKMHQHIVSFQPDGAGTKFELVALDLPKTSKESD